MGYSTIQLEDPKYGVIVPLRAFGQYGYRISNPRLFLETLVGNMTTFSADKINDYFKGKVLSSLTSLISSKLIKDSISVLEINALLDEMSNFAIEKLNIDFIKFGIELVNFNFISINVPEKDPSIVKLKEAKDLAQNEGGAVGNLLGAGIGLGVGLGAGNQMGGVAGNLNTNTPPPPPPTMVEFFCIVQ
jgi:membrane protease subunit (stomatin/prohibitin family)